ncbi:MAG: PatB family C-S lyase [Deltaproteobacteria bacterium]|nr:PatB family C-S lyase [Deltaproteobacteria bacterium]
MENDFSKIIDRSGTHTEKYDSRISIFGTDEAEPFWVADMNLPSPDFLTQDLINRVNHPIYGYTTHYDEIYESIIWWMKTLHQLEISREHLFLSPSVVTTINHAISILSKPDDSIVILSPVYGPFFSSVKNQKRKIIDFPLELIDNRYEFNFNALRQVIEQQKPSMLMMCNPQNPGGRVYTPDELKKLVDISIEYNMKIFCDEIHSDIVFHPHKHTSLFTVKNADKISIVAHSPGKTFNTSGIQASFAMIKNPELMEKFSDAQRNTHTGDINLFGKTVITSVFSPKGLEHRNSVLDYIQKNMLEARTRLLKIRDISVLPVEATYLLWIDFNKLGTESEIMEILLKKASVALGNGSFFGEAGRGFFRINCAHPESQLLGAIDRIVSVFS